MIDRHKPAVALAGAGLFIFVSAACFTRAHADDEIVFDDVQRQTAELLNYERTIQLTPAQEAIKKEALSEIPAPCCSDNSVYTCCCPCNLAKTVWGLSQYLIAKQGYDADQVRKKVTEWIAFINPGGFSGDVCYTAGGCGRAFERNGCGGMRADHVVF